MALSKGAIIDTPGIREYGLAFDPDDILAGFIELAPFCTLLPFSRLQTYRIHAQLCDVAGGDRRASASKAGG